jgi:UDP-glucuronate 4-epimerase
MALFKFTRAILSGAPIDVYNHGRMQRDFTYVDDLVDSIARLVEVAPERPSGPEAIAAGDSLSPVAPYRVVNIGNATPVPLMEFIAAIEAATGQTAQKNMMEMQPGDVPATWADTALLTALTGQRPTTPVAEGVARFVDWYRGYYRV